MSQEKQVPKKVLTAAERKEKREAQRQADEAWRKEVHEREALAALEHHQKIRELAGSAKMADAIESIVAMLDWDHGYKRKPLEMDLWFEVAARKPRPDEGWQFTTRARVGVCPAKAARRGSLLESIIMALEAAMHEYRDRAFYEQMGYEGEEGVLDDDDEDALT